MAEIELLRVLTGRFLQEYDPEEKPSLCEALIIADCIEYSTWDDEDEARAVVDILTQIALSDEVIERRDGTLEKLVHSAISLALIVGGIGY